MQRITTNVEPEYLTRPEAAAFLSLTTETLKRWYAESRGPRAVKFGTARSARVRYARSDLVAFAKNPAAYTEPARPEGVPHFEPPSRGNKRKRKAAT